MGREEGEERERGRGEGKKGEGRNGEREGVWEGGGKRGG